MKTLGEMSVQNKLFAHEKECFFGMFCFVGFFRLLICMRKNSNLERISEGKLRAW